MNGMPEDIRSMPNDVLAASITLARIWLQEGPEPVIQERLALMEREQSGRTDANEDGYWLGRFAMAVAVSLPRMRKSQDAQRSLSGVLADYVRSPAADPEVSKLLLEQTRLR